MQPKLISTAPAVTAICKHPYNVETWTNDRGETIVRHDAYQHPNAKHYDDNAHDLCHDCYCAIMDRRTAGMTFDQMRRAFGGR